MSKNTTGILKYISSFSEPHTHPSTKALASSRYCQCCGLLTIDPLGLRVMALEFRFEQILHSQLGVAPSLAVGCKNKNKPWIVNVKYGYGQTYQTSLLSNKPICSPALADLEIHFHHWNWDVFSTSKNTKSPLKIMLESFLWLYSHLVDVFGTKPLKTQVHIVLGDPDRVYNITFYLLINNRLKFIHNDQYYW